MNRFINEREYFIELIIDDCFKTSICRKVKSLDEAFALSNRVRARIIDSNMKGFIVLIKNDLNQVLSFKAHV